MENILKNQIVVVCFGTPTVPGDALGPKIGTILTSKFDIQCFVYGTESHPITAKNMGDFLPFIRSAHKGATVLSVDASLGEKSKIGKFSLRDDGVCPAGIKGNKDRFGDVGILGVVGEKGENNLRTLLTVKADEVSKLAYKIAIVIKTAVEQLAQNNVNL